MGSSDGRRARVRFALAQMSGQNRAHDFERLCFETARLTISSNLVLPTGPVGDGGDGGVDFEVFASSYDRRQAGAVAAGIAPDEPVHFACTLQRKDLVQKLRNDVEAMHGSRSSLGWVVAYFEADLTGRVRRSMHEAVTSFGARLVLFDGSDLADMYAGPDRQLSELADRFLHTGDVADSSVPHGLPPAPITFVNRSQELALLDAVAVESETWPGPRVAVLSGMSGVGKSAAGRYWAARNRRRFDGGDLYADLSRRRHGDSVLMGEIIADFIEDLGVERDAIPHDDGARQRLYRRLTSSRRLLVVLDDVEYAAQVAHALPAGAGSMVLVTTSKRLGDLYADGARRVPFGPLDEAASLDLLRDLLGSAAVDAEIDAAQALVAACGGLPIAIAACAGPIAASPDPSIRGAVDRLVADGRTGSTSIASRTDPVFDLAYRGLSEPARRLYRRLGLHRGREVAQRVCCVLLDGDELAARSAAAELHGAHLLEPSGPDRWQSHQLIHRHAARTITEVEPDMERDTAVRNLVEDYYRLCQAADWAVVADRLRLTERPVGEPTFASRDVAFDWFAQERLNVLDAVREASDREWDELVWRFAEALWPLCASHKRFAEWTESHLLAARSAERIGHKAAAARVRSQLARAYAELGDLAGSEREMAAARLAVAEAGEPMLEASVIEFGGVCALRLGNPGEALGAFIDARTRFAGLGNTRGVALADLYAGSSLVQLGRFADALEALAASVAGLEPAGDVISIARAQVRMGEAHLGLGETAEAETVLAEAVAQLGPLGIAAEQAEANELLGVAAAQRGDNVGERTHLQLAYGLFEQIGDARSERVLSRLGELR